MKKLAFASAIMTAIGASMVQATPAEQQESERNSGLVAINIPAQSVGDALNEFAAQSGLQIVFYTELGEGIKTKWLAGDFASEAEALNQLLADTGLAYEYLNERTVAIGLMEDNRGKFKLMSNNGLSAQAGASAGQNRATRRSQKLIDKNKTILSVEEVVVTAQKREESMQDVPISMTAISNSSLEKRGIQNLSGLETMVPNFSFDPGFGSADLTQVTIRGITSNARNAGFESGASIYIDGVYVGRPQSFNQNLLNIERVEVLRGPQGTLFGKNTIAGAVNIVTKKPDEELEAKVSVDLGNNNAKRLNSYISGEVINNKLFVGASAYVNQRDGFIKNLYDGSDLADEDNMGGEVKARWLASDNLEINARFHVLKDDHTGGFLESLDGWAFGTLYAPGIRTDAVNVVPKEKREEHGASITMDYQLPDNYSLASISAYNQSKLRHSEDNDTSPLDFIYVEDWVDVVEHVSQEFRLTSPSDGSFDYVVGLYLFWQHVDSDHPAVLGVDAAPLTGVITPAAEIETKSAALFGQANYHFTDRLTLNVGLRYTLDKKILKDYDQIHDITALQGIYPSFNNLTDKRTDSGLSPMLGIFYTVEEDVNVYAKVARGFKGGGWNTDYITSVEGLSFDPEFATNFEVGMKSKLFDNRLMLNMAVFQTKYDDLQVSQWRGNLGGYFIDNAGQATINGMEIDATVALSENLTFRSGLGYTDARFDQFKNGGGEGIDFDGNRLESAPKWSGTLGLDYQYFLSDFGTIELALNYSYKGSFHPDAANDPILEVDGRSLLGGRFGFISLNEKWELFLHGDNLLDKDYEITKRRLATAGIPVVGYGLPRTYGLQLTYRF